MMLQIKRWFAPPVFPDDEPKTRRAILLNFALLTCMVLALCLIAGNLTGGTVPPVVTGLDIGLVGVCLVLRRWTNQGRVRLASGALLAVGLVGITMAVAILGTIRTPTTAVYMVLVIFAGLLFDLNGMIAMTVLCSLTIGGLIVAENAGLLPHPDYAVTISQWVTYTVLFVGVGCLTLSSLQSTRRALAEAEMEISERKQAEKALRTSEARYRAIYEGANVGIAFGNLAGHFVDINPAIQNILGYRLEQLSGKTMAEITHPDDLAMDFRLFQETIEGRRQGYQIEKRYFHKDGHIIWGNSHIAVVHDQNGKPEYAIGMIEDITERKRVEEALRESEKEFRSLFENSLIGISQALPDGHLIRANIAYAHMYGYDNPDEMIADVTNIEQLYANREDRKEVLRILAARGVMEPREMTVVRRDGTRFIILVSARAVRDSEGNLLYHQAEHVEITERKEVEKKLVESESRLSALFDSTGYAISLAKNGIQILGNPAYLTLFGYKEPSAIIGKPVINTIAPEERNRISKYVADRAIGKEVPNHYQTKGLRRNGTIFDMEVMISTYVFNNEIYTVGFQNDITERKKTEKALEQSSEQLRALTHYWQAAIEAERTAIAREIHDEFGQSMTALKMDLTWLAKHLPEEDENVDRIRGMTTLVDESVARMRRIATNLRPGLLDDLGLNAALEWQAQEFSRHSGIPCKLNLPEDDPGVDPALCTTLFRIFQETLTNIARHAQATRVSVSLKQNERTLTLTMRDNGRGITNVELANPRSLGLLGLRERAAQWGGETSLRGVAGKGTIVTVRIPLPASPVTGGGR